MKMDYNQEKIYEQKQEALKRLSKYANVIDLVFTDYDRKSTDETMMIKSFRKSNLESTNRKTHSENLEGIAEIIAEGIELNVPVVRIMARHHDIGHTFLGHSGEWWLSEIKKNRGLGSYVHNSLGVRELVYGHGVEEKIKSALKIVYLGNENLDDDEIDKVCDDLWLIFDAINSHNGELSESSYEPNFEKTKKDYEEEVKKCHIVEGYDKTLIPATTEGCLMRLCDKISYIPYDMVDGLREGMIDHLDEEYMEVLIPILTNDNSCTEKQAREYIDNAVLKRNYSSLARKLQMIFVSDVIQNSNKEKIAMSDKMSELMHKLRKVNNEKVVNYVLMEEDHKTYPQALKELMEECKDILIDEDIVYELNGSDVNIELSQRLIEKYKNTPYLGFMEYVLNTNKEDFEWTEEMVNNAREEATKTEIDEAYEIILDPRKEKHVGGQERREHRIKMYRTFLQEQIRKLEEKGNTCDEDDIQKMKKFIFDNMVNRDDLYSSNKIRLSLEFGAKYLATLSDTEFMQLLRDTGKVNDEQYESLTRKYKDIDLKSEYMTHSNWDKISYEQNEAIETLEDEEIEFS